jgi:hypothetical protein
VLVFLHIPKTAGSTFNFILENSFGVSACHTNHTKKPIFDQSDFDLARKLFPFLRSISGHNLIDPLSLSVPDPFYMTFLREPVARVISQYRDSQTLGQNRKTFEESVRADEQYENLHVKLMAGERNLDKAKRFLEKCGFVGLTEKFDLSLHVLSRLSPCRLNLKYKRRRVTPRGSSKATLESDNRLVELAREYNKLDLALYAFAVDEIFPKLCEKAGMRPSDEVASYDHYSSEIHPKFLAFSLYNMLFYRQLCKLLYRRKLRVGEVERV